MSTSFVKVDGAYYFVDQYSRRSVIPKTVFKNIFDKVDELLKNSTLPEIKREIKNILQTSDEAVETLFDITIKKRKEIADNLLQEERKISISKFNLSYQLMLLPHSLPYLKHQFWDSKNFLCSLYDSNLIVEDLDINEKNFLNACYQKFPLLANIEPVLLKPKDIFADRVVQQIIQYYIEKEKENPNSVVDIFFITVSVLVCIEELDIKNLFPELNYDRRWVHARVKETRQLMIPQEEMRERKNKVVKREGQPDVHHNVNQDACISDDGANNNNAALNIYSLENDETTFENVNNAKKVVTLPELITLVSDTINSFYNKGWNLSEDILVKVKNEVDETQFELYGLNQIFSNLVKEKSEAVIAHEIEHHLPQLNSIEPKIIRSHNLVLDTFLQKLIQYEISIHTDLNKVVEEIVSILNNKRLKPLFFLYNVRSIKKRIAETNRDIRPVRKGNEIRLFIKNKIDQYYNEGFKFAFTDLLNKLRDDAVEAFQSKEHSGLVEGIISPILKEKKLKVVKNEIDQHFPHLRDLQPMIIRKSNKEVDEFVQRLIQYEIAQTQDNHLVLDKIMPILKNPRLAPFFYIYDRAMVDKRINETKNVR